MGLTTRYLGRITGSGLLSTISVCVCVCGRRGRVRGLCSCIHKRRTPEGGKGKERDWRKEFCGSIFLVSSGITCRVSGPPLTCLLYFSFSVTARVRLSLISLSVSTCLLLISSFIAFLFTCLRLLLLHGSNWDFEIECSVLFGRSAWRGRRMSLLLP